MLGLLIPLIWFVALVLFIIVLIKQFQIGGPIHGMIGIITAGLWTFIWGWINADRAGIKNIMLAWTGLVVLSMIVGFLGGMSAMSQKY